MLNSVALLTCAILLATMTWTNRRTRKRAGIQGISILPLMGFYYVLTYGVGSIYFSTRELSDARFEATNNSFVWGSTLALLTYAAVSVGARGTLLLRPPPEPDPRRQRSTIPALAVFAIVGWASRIALYKSGFYFHHVESFDGSQFRSLLSTLSLAPLAIPISRLSSSAGKIDRSTKLLLLIEVLWAAPSGSREGVLLVGIVALIAASYRAGTLKTVGSTRLVIAGAVSLLLFPMIAVYRGTNAADYQGQPISRLVESASLLAEDPKSFVLTIPDAVLGRFSDALVVAKAHDRSVNTVWGTDEGSTTDWIVAGWVPRALWPDKPNPPTFGNDLGHELDLLHPLDDTTTITSGHPLELYANFGWMGVLFGGLILGIVLQLVECLLSRMTASPLSGAIAAIVTWQFARSPATLLSGGVNSSFKTLLLFAGLLSIANVASGLASRSLRKSDLRAGQNAGAHSSSQKPAVIGIAPSFDDNDHRDQATEHCQNDKVSECSKFDAHSPNVGGMTQQHLTCTNRNTQLQAEQKRGRSSQHRTPAALQHS